MIHVNHPRLGPGKKYAGLVVASDRNELTLSQAVDLSSTDKWLVVLRGENGAPSVPLTFELLSENKIRLVDVPPFGMVTDPNRERTHFMIAPAGEVVYPVKVQGVEPSGEADVRISGVLEDNMVHDDDGVAPPLPPDVGIPPTAPGVVTDLRATQGGTLTRPVINLSWVPAPKSDKYFIEYSSDNRLTWQPAGDGVSFTTRHSFPCEPGDITVRVAGVGAVRGEWRYLDLDAGGNFDTPGAVSIALAEPFTGDALKVRWDVEPAAAHYELQVVSDNAVRRSATIERGVGVWQYHYLDARMDGASRRLTVRMRAINAQKVPGPWSQISAVNASPAVPANIQVFEYVDSFAITADLPGETIKELRVYGSQTAGFTPDPTNLLGSSTTTQVSINHSGIWFFRVCWLDNWGEDDLQMSAEIESKSGDADIDLGPIEDQLSDLDDKIEIVEEQIGDVEVDIDGLHQRISTVQATADGNKATVQQHSTAIATVQDGIAKVETSWGVSLDVNGYCSGFAMNNDGDTSSALFRADTFAVGSPGVNALTFVVSGGAVMMPGVSIQNGSISAQKLSVTNLSAISANMGTVTGGTFKTNTAVGARVELTSTDTLPFWIGSGVKNTGNGKLYYESNTGRLVFKGDLALQSASSGARMDINNRRIRVYDANNRLRVEIGELS